MSEELLWRANKLHDLRKAIETRIEILQDWIDYQIGIDGGISEVENINKIRREIDWLKIKLDDLNDLEAKGLEASPYIQQVPYYIFNNYYNPSYTNNPYNPYIGLSDEDILNSTLEEVVNFKEID